MANPRGVFTDELVPEGWFDETAQAAGWFDQDNLDAAAASGSPYTLPVSTAAVTLTGSTVALRRALRLSVSTRAITLTGSSVVARFGHKLPVATRAVTLTGSSVTPRAARRLAVATTAVTLTGSTVGLTYVAGPKVLEVDSAAITLTGSEIGLTYTSSTPTRRGDDGGTFSFTGAARKAIYERQLSALEDELETAPKPAKRKEKAAKIREIVLQSDGPVFEAVAAEITPLLAQFTAQEIDWAALANAVQAQIEQARAAQRKRRHRHIAIAMLMAA